MKKIVIVSDSIKKNNRENPVAKHIKSNLEELFENRVAYQIVYIDELEPSTRIDGDLFLVMSSARGNIVKHHVDDPTKIIVVRRTFLREDIEPLYNIPQNEDVLIVNDDAETIFESVAVLYQIGIRHINLVPFEWDKNYRHIRYAISPSESDFIPKYIENIIDIGNRMIDISTILFIMSHLDLQDKKTQSNFFQYHQKLLSLDGNLEDHYNQLLVRTDELDCVLNLSHDGILLTDRSGKILLANKIFKQIFDISVAVEGHFLNELVPSIDFSIYENTNTADDLINFRSKIIKMEKSEITHYNKNVKIYYNFQEVTYIKKLEQNLTQKLRQKGQIAKYCFDDIITQSPSILSIIEKSKKIAQSDLTVLITGESGTGKEVLAQALHNASKRYNQPFIAINAAAIPENLLESELFGYVSGSFTGASKDGKKGIFERANNGTIFLDEIGDMPMHLQSKLLRVLQEKQISPIGADHIIDIDVRVIAATHNDLVESVNQGHFRRDLYYRLNVFPLELPPLRERRSDIQILLEHFTDGKYKLDESSKALLIAYDWPGNIREISNVAHYITTLDESQVITPESLPSYIRHYSLTQISEPIENNNYKILSTHFDINTVGAVLSAIKFLNTIEKSSGRKHLLNYLSSEKVDLQENRLRKILGLLSDLELIEIKKGRSGNYMTSKGLDLLSCIEDEAKI